MIETFKWKCPDCGWWNFTKFTWLGRLMAMSIKCRCRNIECKTEIFYNRELAHNEYLQRIGI